MIYIVVESFCYSIFSCILRVNLLEQSVNKLRSMLPDTLVVRNKGLPIQLFENAYSGSAKSMSRKSLCQLNAQFFLTARVQSECR